MRYPNETGVSVPQAPFPIFILMELNKYPQATSSLLQKVQRSEDGSQGCTDGNFEDVPSKDFLEKLNRFALRKLGAIVDLRSLNYQGWQYGQRELIAAKQLLDRFNGQY